MRILLIDDSLKHRRAGKQQLEDIGHEVIALCDYTEAQQIAQKERFDAALIDLLMPAESTTLSPDAITQYVGVEIAVGFPLALVLAKSGIRLIAVATDMNHHNHPSSAMVDWFEHRPLTVNGATVLIIPAPMCEDRTKDWKQILTRLVA